MQLSQNLNPSALRYRGHYYPLNKPQIVIGSDPACDISIEDNPSVFPMHAQIIAHAGQIYLQALESNAPIWINGTPVTQHVLRDQDIIHLGNRESKLTFLLHWSPTGVEQTMILPPGGQPITDRHAAPQVQESAYSSTQYTGKQPLARQAPFHMPDPPAQTQATNSHAQLDFVTHNQTHAQAQAAPQGQTQGQAFTPQAQAAYAPAFTPQGQIPPTPPQTPALQPHQQPAPHAAANSMATNTTRYLCAAGHLDEGFQDYVLRHIIHEERRALGETYGVDMLAVVSWCKAGLRRINVRDTILTILLILSLLLPIGTILAFIRGAAMIGAASSSYSYAPTPTPLSSLASLAPLGGILFLLIGFWTVTLLLIAFGLEAWVKRHWPRSHSGIISLLVLPWLLFPTGLILVPLSWLVIFVELIWRFYGSELAPLNKYRFNPQARPVALDQALETKLRANFTTAHRNVIAYSGYQPFAGAGDYLTGWSFVIDTSKGTPLALDISATPARETPQTFATSSLYEAIEKDIRDLKLHDSLEIEGKLYVRGQYLPEHQPFFNSIGLCPVTTVDPKLVEHYKEHPTEDIRYYLCMRFNSWQGEIIFSAFLRLIQRGKSLFIEFDYLLLPPLHPDYYWIDEKEATPVLNKIGQLFLRSFDRPVKILLTAPYRLLRGSLYSAQQRKLARIAPTTPAFDYGAISSVRYAASDDDYHLFFQKLDKEMYLKTMQKQMLETIYNFLCKHKIDTSDFNRQQQTILNSGTIVSGQEINIGAMSTGEGGHATNNAPSPAQGVNAAQHKP